VRVEGDGNGSESIGAGAFQEQADKVLMAAVDAIEDAYGDGAGASGGYAGELSPGEEFAHRRGP